MKNVLFGAFALVALSFTSCSSDDDSSADGGAIAGTYDLEEVNVDQAVDFNLNGTANTDLTEETNCYDSGRMKLNADGTLSYTQSYVLVDEANGTSVCADNTFEGTWVIDTQAGSTIVLRATYVDDNEDENVIMLTKQGDKLRFTELFGQYPDRNSDDGAIYSTGTVEYVFDK
ncbi:MAG: hypothetical protein EOO88_57975 [Pedobacter sp.]|nr:MAG: hypothetical protein EOO88_57975 [Pedobacter sp.]